jgi:hypothetical protein
LNNSIRQPSPALSLATIACPQQFDSHAMVEQKQFETSVSPQVVAAKKTWQQQIAK